MGKPLITESPIVEYCYIRSILREKRKSEAGFYVYLGIVYELQDVDKNTLKTASYETTLLPEKETPYTDADIFGSNYGVEAIIANLKKELAGYPAEQTTQEEVNG